MRSFKNVVSVGRLFGLMAFVLAGWLGASVRVTANDDHAVFLQQYCSDCHSGSDAEGQFDLDSLGTDFADPAVLAKWVRLFDRVESNEMPPEDYDLPSALARTEFLESLNQVLTQASAKNSRMTLRRLNRVEFENTLNDLLGVREPLKDLLPEDGKSKGFDNVGESLDLSAVHLERYMTAADQAISAAVRKTPKPEVMRSTHTLADGKNSGNIGKHWHQTKDGSVVIFSNGGFPRPEVDSFRAPHEGNYRITVKGYAYQSDQPVSVTLWQGVFNPGGTTEKVTTLVFPPRADEVSVSHELTVWLKPNARLTFLPELIVDNAKLRKDGPAKYDGRGLAISTVEVEGPLFDEWPGRGHNLLFDNLPIREIEPANPQVKKRKYYRPQFEIASQNASSDAERLLTRFLPFAFRRPVNSNEILPLLELAKSELDAGESFEQAMRTAYIAAFCSPDFLYMREQEDAFKDFALASRLSYAFWNTMPDAQLLRLASRNELSKSDVLRSQVERMLNDSRSSRFVTTFTGQWLNLREIDFTIPDKQLYPEYDDALKDAMIAETESFFSEVLRKDLKVQEFIDSDWTMLNERLARHYRIDGVEGQEMRRVALQPKHHRGGVLTHASVLKVSANGTTTSPVIRGIFVLERLLGKEPPAPPPGVPGVEPDIRGATTLREQLAKHRELGTCNACHKMIDPPGFALENYDVMGGWRENYRSLNRDFPMPATELRGDVRNIKWRIGPSVDASGETSAGRQFNDIKDYKQILLADPYAITYVLAEKIATYISGRAMGFADRQELHRITRAVAKEGYGFRTLVHTVVQSELLRNDQ